MESYCKILIIDDEIIMRQGIKYLLDWEKEGFQIAGEASGGREGLELVEELPISSSAIWSCRVWTE